MSKTDYCMGRRAVACEHWKIMGGMIGLNGWRVVAVHGDNIDWGEWRTRPPTEWIPDLRDPATLGCIEHGLLPAAWASDAQVIEMLDAVTSRLDADAPLGAYVPPYVDRIRVDVVTSTVTCPKTGDVSDGYRARVRVWVGNWVTRWESCHWFNRLDAMLDCLEAAP